ncbi:MAG: 1-deoxy-D-xylulose-5-phosphate reductoisomerase [Candidatus Micrarchaeia archaeon]|jgi:1-deoxy-D-xylulose-5-phosphate reductoisomerase
MDIIHKKISILGSTGSIGTQTLGAIANLNTQGHNFEIESLAVKDKRDFKNLKPQIDKFHPNKICIFEKDDVKEFKKEVSFEGEILTGNEGLIELSKDNQIDTLVVSVVGAVGIQATLEGLQNDKQVCIATKEVLVAAGDIVMPLARRDNGELRLLPIDSEHSAILQCIIGENWKEIKEIIITASGGSLRDWPKRKMENATVEEVLAHPNWAMGSKITVDSASMMNKGLEIIEAHQLYGKNIIPVIHRQSIIHSMVRFTDGSIKAQLGLPDMTLPIQYSLTYPKRYPSLEPELDFTKLQTWTFEPMPFDKFPCLSLAIEAGKIGGTMPAIMNATNEIAVYAFLDKQINFGKIPKIIRKVMDILSNSIIEKPEISDIFVADREARVEAKRIIKKLSN